MAYKPHSKKGDFPSGLTFGKRIRQLRQGLGLSVANFARKVGFDRTYVYKLEKEDATNPSLKFIESVVENFGVDREWFVGGVGDGTALKITTTPYRSGIDGHIRMRLECLLDIIETYDDKQMNAALDHFSKLADTDKEFGKISGEVANVIAHATLRRQMKKK